jgi:neurofibromin 1
VKTVQFDPDRTPAFVVMEISFLVALASSNNTISQLAAKGLRLISHAERHPDAPPNPIISDDDRAQRNPIYEQLGDPRITVIGRFTIS